MDIQKELEKLRNAIDAPRPDSAGILSILEVILTWLNDNNQVVNGGSVTVVTVGSYLDVELSP